MNSRPKSSIELTEQSKADYTEAVKQHKLQRDTYIIVGAVIIFFCTYGLAIYFVFATIIDAMSQ